MMQRRSTRIRDRARDTMNNNDRISRLPNEIIHHIYSFIDTRYCVQSSLLSRRWRNTWKSHPLLNLKIDRSFRCPNFVHRFLSARDDSVIVSAIDFQSNSIRRSLLKDIISYAMLNRTLKLKIEFLGDKPTRRGGFDVSIFRSRFLQHLDLRIDFEVVKTPILTWYLPALTTLNLEGVRFTQYVPNDGASYSIELFSRFANLKTLVLTDCRLSNFDTFVIMSTRLENLSMLNLIYTCKFVISAPKLSSFTYYGMGDFSLLANDLHSLETVNFQTYYHRSLLEQQRLVELMIENFYQLRKAKFLTLNSDAFRFLSEFPQLLEGRKIPFMRLQSLTMVEVETWLPPNPMLFGLVLAYFRRSSPDLTFKIRY